MSHSELDKPTPVEAYPPIHDFSGLKKLLKSRGYHIPEAVPYKPIDVADVTVGDIQSGTIEFTDDGIFLNTDNVKRQIFPISEITIWNFTVSLDSIFVIVL